MFADKVRIPLKILKSFNGVLPVAITTIMVSPKARLTPIIRAEIIPGDAVGSTIFTAVCQRLAPRARDPELRDSGTLLSESSVMEKITGITANPIMKPITKEFLWV